MRSRPLHVLLAFFPLVLTRCDCGTEPLVPIGQDAEVAVDQGVNDAGVIDSSILDGDILTDGAEPDADIMPTCGDGLIRGSEVCDDGNNVSGDGCSSMCVVEPHWICTGEPSNCDCEPGFMEQAMACVDIDECLEIPPPCPPETFCVNTEGSFACVPSELEVVPVYPNHPRWNDYVKNDDPTRDVYRQDDTGCTGAETGGPSACIHAGLKLKVALAPPIASCLGLSLRDGLGAFDWVCDDETLPVTFFMRGLKSTKGLRDLLDENTWFENTVTLSNAMGDLASSTPAVWWPNPVGAFLNSMLTTAYAIYVVPMHTTMGAEIAADGIGLVTLDGAMLTGAVTVNNQNFLWIEGNFNAGGSNTAIYFNEVNFSAIRRAVAANATYDAIALWDSSGNVVSQVTASNATWNGIALWDATENAFSDVLAASSSWSGIDLHDSSNNNSFSQVTSVLNGWDGITIRESSDNYILNMLSIQNGWSGIDIGGTPAGTGNVFAQIAIQNAGQTVNTAFTGNLLIGGACSGATCPNQPMNTANVLQNVSIGGSNVGAITADDTANFSDISGVGTAPGLGDWTQFEHRLRAWRRQAATAKCEMGVCQIWDWSLRQGDTVLLGTSGDGMAQVQPFVASDPCPAEADGSAVLDRAGVPFLKSAIEILADSVGDEDGLCESFEVCVYAPSFGAYQGHDPYDDTACLFQNGDVQNVTLYGHPTQGR